MSSEGLDWLNTHTLIGQTSRRGRAWHYRRESQGDEPNHYPGAIPVDDVRRRLFGWEGVFRRVAVEMPAQDLTEWSHLDEDGRPSQWVVLDRRRAVDRSDRETGEVFAVVGGDYEIHQYSDWLLTNVANLLDDGLSISSAGLLKGGAVAWVEISVPENKSTAEGVEFRPNLLATTTMDGASATTYKRTVTDVVCDNTRAVALKESGAQLKFRHSKHAALRVVEARQALQLVAAIEDDFSRQVAELCKVRVTDRQWEKFLDRWVPWGTKSGKEDSDYMRALKEDKREALTTIYRDDPRCAPWRGTAHGVVQAVNTYDHHIRTPNNVKSWGTADRVNRNMQWTVDGRFENLDRDTCRELGRVLGGPVGGVSLDA